VQFLQAVNLDFVDMIESTAADGTYMDFGSFNLNGVDLRNEASKSQLSNGNVLNGRTSAPTSPGMACRRSGSACGTPRRGACG